jgi:hypothetical protein
MIFDWARLLHKSLMFITQPRDTPAEDPEELDRGDSG